MPLIPGQLKKIRLGNRIDLLELAATTGLPAEHIRKIEEDEIVALNSDLARIEKGLCALLERNKDDSGRADVF